MVGEIAILGNALKKYIVTPLNAFGLGGFVFDIEGETSVALQTDITDHYLEDNSAVQDHAALRPKKITLKGYQGELVYKGDGRGEPFIEKLTQKLTVISSFIPQLSKAAGQIINIRKSGISAVSLKGINQISDLWAFAKNVTQPQSRQQQAYQYFKALQEGRFLVSVQTPFEFMNRMMIESIIAKQDEGSKFISDFTIVLKEIRTVELLNVAAKESAYTTNDESAEDYYSGRAGAQNEKLTQVGNMDGLPADLEDVIVDMTAGDIEDAIGGIDKSTLDDYLIESGSFTPEQIKEFDAILREQNQ